MNKRENSLLFIGIAGLAAMIALSGCGNTISGIGKDITDVGAKLCSCTPRSCVSAI